jgi:hypothetical protein
VLWPLKATETKTANKLARRRLRLRMGVAPRKRDPYLSRSLAGVKR